MCAAGNLTRFVGASEGGYGVEKERVDPSCTITQYRRRIDTDLDIYVA